jgi:predicted aspartyl protease
MRIITTAALLVPLALLQTGAALAADCKLQMFDTTPMLQRPDGRYLVPVSINGTRENFLFDTGGSRTQISRPLAEDLKLYIHQGRIELFDATGNISRDVASVKEMTIAHMRGTDLELPIAPSGVDGVVALDHMATLDVDMDFGASKLNFFSPDHCTGQVVYWTSPASVAVVPMDILSDYHLRIPVTLDGHTEQAIIDTGAVRTLIQMDEEQRVFNLALGDADTPASGVLNGDPSLKMYRHRFKSLSFGDVTVNNPEVYIAPNAMGRNADKSQLVGDRTKSEKDLLAVPDMIIGMDVLRQLHIYIAFKERKMYISQASISPAAAPPAAAPSAPAPQ